MLSLPVAASGGNGPTGPAREARSAAAPDDTTVRTVWLRVPDDPSVAR